MDLPPRGHRGRVTGAGARPSGHGAHRGGFRTPVAEDRPQDDVEPPGRDQSRGRPGHAASASKATSTSAVPRYPRRRPGLPPLSARGTPGPGTRTGIGPAPGHRRPFQAVAVGEVVVGGQRQHTGVPLDAAPVPPRALGPFDDHPAPLPERPLPGTHSDPRATGRTGRLSTPVRSTMMITPSGPPQGKRPVNGAFRESDSLCRHGPAARRTLWRRRPRQAPSTHARPGR